MIALGLSMGCACYFTSKPDNKLTIKDLFRWPDFCNGSFTQYCDFSRQYDPHPSPNVTDGMPVPPYNGPGVDTFIKAFGRYDLLDFMNRYWINQGDTNAHFWAHEFSKHATCFSTYDVKCYKPYKEHEDVIDFFQVGSHLNPLQDFY
jgi:ribonuclease T2